MHQINTEAPTQCWVGQSLLRRMQNIILGPGILCQNLCSPRRPPLWFTKHHLRCFTINNASSGDKLELEEAAWQHAAALLRGDRANRSGQHSKPSSTLIHKQVSDLEFNLPIYISRPCYFTKISPKFHLLSLQRACQQSQLPPLHT